ncbi:Uncharacterised protein [Delftia tsuruhatensis]|uniref:hypothetical protein n=1 Tax=Delftia tsuruhatensis TaxID=180282 RepID=UPI001E793426|nr:hypothetical protein [Delftia tsuruhatensis]CAB5716638.1 Uncharacterised protein [Delftia tsuruhatensis]CAC9685902.1 Uncharacterised protein [Delftia tsuruhatensis]
MGNETLALHLYKANVELQLHITRLLQEIGHHWLESARHSNAESTTETNAEIADLLRSSNWQSLATLPSESFCRLFELRARDLQFNQQVAIKNQAAFISGLQKALDNWHRSVANAVGDAPVAQPGQEIIRQWMKAWPSPPGTTQD